METSARLVDISKDWKTGKTRLTMEADGIPPREAEKYAEKKLRLKIVEWRDKRTLDANAYYWVLVTKLAEVLKQTLPAIHNIMLRRYGQPDIYDGKLAYIVLPDSEETEKKALQAETYHIKPLSQVKEGKDGKMYRTYILLRGSSSYDTKEMSALIDGIVGECREVGIETLPPAELERIMAAYEQKHHPA